MENQLDATKQQLTVANSRYGSIQNALTKAEETISSLRSELSESMTRANVAERTALILERDKANLTAINHQLMANNYQTT
ncbi:hypothetical protein [Vibrio jasicida]|uniref:hypothetical protein n=1 Tax=Vibrio jasicida TaxID=766224 RepID=UPI002157F003|nr:hypothetical protein [Vibrio jasicida]